MRKVLVSALALFCLAAAGSARAADTAVLARGKQLMEGIVACGNCHMAVSPQGGPQFGKPLTGGFKFDDPAFTAYAQRTKRLVPFVLTVSSATPKYASMLVALLLRLVVGVPVPVSW